MDVRSCQKQCGNSKLDTLGEWLANMLLCAVQTNMCVMTQSGAQSGAVELSAQQTGMYSSQVPFEHGMVSLVLPELSSQAFLELPVHRTCT